MGNSKVEGHRWRRGAYIGKYGEYMRVGERYYAGLRYKIKMKERKIGSGNDRLRRTEADGFENGSPKKHEELRIERGRRCQDDRHCTILFVTGS